MNPTLFRYQRFITNDDLEVDQTLFTNISSELYFQLDWGKNLGLFIKGYSLYW